jgi:uncharacterized protein YaaW (UPF0174 family)
MKWINKRFMQESVSQRKVVENLIKEIGEDIIEKMIKEKYTKMVVESVSDEIDKKLEKITFIPRTIYKSKK